MVKYVMLKYVKFYYKTSIYLPLLQTRLAVSETRKNLKHVITLKSLLPMTLRMKSRMTMYTLCTSWHDPHVRFLYKENKLSKYPLSKKHPMHTCYVQYNIV